MKYSTERQASHLLSEVLQNLVLKYFSCHIILQITSVFQIQHQGTFCWVCYTLMYFLETLLFMVFTIKWSVLIILASNKGLFLLIIPAQYREVIVNFSPKWNTTFYYTAPWSTVHSVRKWGSDHVVTMYCNYYMSYDYGLVLSILWDKYTPKDNTL